MFKRIVVALVLASVVLTSSAKAMAAEKIALVRLQHAMYQVNDGKKLKSKIDKEIASKKKEIEKLRDQLKKESDALEKQKMVLSQDALKSKTKDLQTKFIEMQKKAATFEKEIRQSELDASKKILSKLKEVINDISKEKGYTLVIENSLNAVLYAKNAPDITSDVISAYNKKR